MPQLIGPFRQVITLSGLPWQGSLSDDQLEIIENGAVLVEDGKIMEVAPFSRFRPGDFEFREISGEQVLLPGFVDCHTHLIWAGSRARDYTMRTAGKTYQEILAAGGGIFDSVEKTGKAPESELLAGLVKRAARHLKDGVTTIEVKSGYGLVKDQELKLLSVIREAKSAVMADLVPTCLAAHVCPKDFKTAAFLEYLENELLPEVLVSGLSRRVDIFVEDNAFPADLARPYLAAARKLGFDLTIHADQFTTGGSRLAVELGACSADHLEASTEAEIKMLAGSQVMPVALPGASLELGMHFAPARKLLDAGAGLAISTDWNPGSAPMGDLLVQAALLGVYEKLSSAEVLAGITFRAARALNLKDRGRLDSGCKADMVSFPFGDFREILYHQGRVKPSLVWKDGIEC